jgi:ABC-2 type transport system permease protein
MMLRGLWKLTWLEIKIFVREPLGVVGTVGIPVVLFAVLGRLFSRGVAAGSSRPSQFIEMDLPVFGALLIALNAVLSLVTVIAIYREGGILKRLRATPLRPHVILTAHVVVKLLLTAATMALTMLVGAWYYPIHADVRVVAFSMAFFFVTVSILSIGFLIASLVPTARFAQPIGTLLLYPMVAVSGLFVPVESMPTALRVISRVVPLTYAVSLLEGIWKGDAWSAHALDITALVVMFAGCTALSARVFRWE